jgi:ribosome-associated protein
MIYITPTIAINESEIKQEFIRASGPGGQNVNKVSTAVQLRFNVASSPSLPDDIRKRLVNLAGRRITEDGELIIHARRFRTQERNRQDAFDRLVKRKTRPTLQSKRRRLEAKHHRSEAKRMRRPASPSE